MNITTLYYIVGLTGTLGLAVLIFLLDDYRNRLQKRLDAAIAKAEQYRNLWRRAEHGWNQAEDYLRAAKMARDLFKSHAVAGTQAVALLGAALNDAEHRAALHTQMIDQQRIRADLLWAGGREIGRHWVKAENALDSLLDHQVLWSSCPTCGRLVEATGFPSPVGECRTCGAIFTESDLADVDPIVREEVLIDTVWNLYTTAQDLRIHLDVTPNTYGPAADAANAMQKALDAAAKAHPDILTPPSADWRKVAEEIHHDVTVGPDRTPRPPTPPRPRQQFR